MQCLYVAEHEARVVFEGAAYRRVPIEILHLTNAVDMSISRNNIEFLPAEVRNLTNLTRLKMNKNKLVFLPDELCSLTALRHLEIQDNNVCAFPDDLSLLKNLDLLEIDGNFTGNVPPEVKKAGAWLSIEYVMEIKKGRIAGHVNLRGFDLLSMSVDVLQLDRPKRWQKTFVDGVALSPALASGGDLLSEMLRFRNAYVGLQRCIHDRCSRRRRDGCTGYVRVYTEELNKQRKRELEDIKAAELRKVTLRAVLDSIL